jgi:hypothetical protein
MHLCLCTLTGSHWKLGYLKGNKVWTVKGKKGTGIAEGYSTVSRETMPLTMQGV